MMHVSLLLWLRGVKQNPEPCVHGKRRQLFQSIIIFL